MTITQTMVQEATTKKELSALNLTKDNVMDLAFATAYENGTNYYALSIEHGIDDRLIFAVLPWSYDDCPKYFKKKIYDTEKGSYIVMHGQRIYLESFIRRFA